jgi:hypothetical protein
MTRFVQPLDGFFGPRHQFAQLLDVHVQLVAAVLFRLVAALAASTAETKTKWTIFRKFIITSSQ